MPKPITETTCHLFDVEATDAELNWIRSVIKKYAEKNPGASYQIILDCGYDDSQDE